MIVIMSINLLTYAMMSSYLHPSDAPGSGLLSLHFSFQPISQFILIGGEVLQWEIFLALAVCVCVCRLGL